MRSHKRNFKYHAIHFMAGVNFISAGSWSNHSLVYFGVNFTNKAVGRIRSLNNVLTSFLPDQMSFNLCP